MSRRCGLAALLIAFAVGLCAALIFGFRPLVPAGEAAQPQPMTVGDPPAAADRIIGFLEAEAQGVDAFVLHEDSAVTLAWGAVDRPMNTASVRKSVLSLLYGIAWNRGLIDLDATLGGLGIDESRTPLTEVEKTATIADLLAARSGIYLQSGGETAAMRDGRPERGSIAPGEQFFYNNWDFNILVIVFEQETGVPIGQAMNDWLAVPLGMEDFAPQHVYFDRWGSESDYPTYRMFLSARDLARIGTLVARGGVWEGNRIVSDAWLDRSLAPVSEITPGAPEDPIDGYGYSWWLDRDTGDVFASGWGGQYMMVEREEDRVIVVRRDTGQSLLEHLWFREFKARGRPRDLLYIQGLLEGG